MRRRLATALAVLLMAPVPVAAQLDLDVRVTPRAGIVTPAGWFYAEFAHFGVDPVEWTEAVILRSKAAGLAVEVEVGESEVWIRGEVVRTFGGETKLWHAYLHEMAGFNEPEVERIPHKIPSTLTIGSLDVALPTRLRLPLGVQPYITVGIGGKRYDFDVGVIENPDRNLVLPEEGVTLTANLGGGVVVDVKGVRLDLLVRDAMSEYWDALQHDVLWMAGLSWRVF